MPVRYPLLALALSALMTVGPLNAQPTEETMAEHPAVAQVRETLPVPGSVLADPDITALNLQAPPDAGSIMPIDAPDVPGGRALRVQVRRATEQPWGVQLATSIVAPVRRGDTVFASFMIRCIESRDESAEGRLLARGQGGTDPWPEIFSEQVRVPRQWMQVTAFGQADRDYAPGEAGITFHLGYLPQVLEVGPVILLNLGQDVDQRQLPVMSIDYPGRAADAPWREAAAERIRQHRMAEVRVNVIDANGQPVPGAQVRLRMQRHAYGFGTFVEGNSLLQDDQDGERFRQFILEHCSAVTVPIYWADWGIVRPATRERWMEQIEWVHQHKLPMRGHPVVWPGWQWLPTALRRFEDDPQHLGQLVETHVIDIMSATAPYGLFAYDLVNEWRTNHELTDILGDEALVRWFQLAHRVNPQTQLFINDYGMLVSGAMDETALGTYERQIRYLLESGAPVGGIGFQGHFGSGLTDPARIIQALDRFAEFGLPIHVTEFDVDIRDEQAQADYTRDFFTAFFSHPSTEALIMWGFWEKTHWRPNGAMFRTDWSPKPNYHAFRDLVLGEWWTDETLSTGGDGSAAARAFLGDYVIEASSANRTASTLLRLMRDGADLTLVLE